MEHIIQIAVGVDDEAIKQNIAMHAEETITKNIQQQVMNKLFEGNYWNSNATEKDPLSNYSRRLIDEFLEKHKDELLNKAASYLAEKLARSKRGKELLEDVTK